MLNKNLFGFSWVDIDSARNNHVTETIGDEVAANIEGRLFFKDATGRGVIYPNDAEKTKAANISPGVFTLGEIGYVNEAGYVYITDRFSDMVVSGGVNIYPAEAEQVLVQHPGLLDVACIGGPHNELGEAAYFSIRDFTCLIYFVSLLVSSAK